MTEEDYEEEEASESLELQKVIRLDEQPKCIKGGKMRDYQLVGLNWLYAMRKLQLGCILADDMGLGKTLQTIALLAHLKFERGLAGASLVICPLSVLATWTGELARWCPRLRVIKLHSADDAERERQASPSGIHRGREHHTKALLDRA